MARINEMSPNSYSNVTTLPYSLFEKAGEYYSKVQERLKRAAAALEQAGVSYAVIGGNAVMLWVAQADESGLRPTQDVDLLLGQGMLEQAKTALAAAGFLYRHSCGIDMFLDGPDGKAREAVHVIEAGKLVRPEYTVPAPEITEVVRIQDRVMVITLEALVRMKLTSYRFKDIVHLQDMVGVGLIKPDWPERYPSPLRERLIEVFENPEA